MRSPWRCVTCWLRGHRWLVLAEDWTASSRVHLQSLAGCAAICERCGDTWDDMAGWDLRIEHNAPLPFTRWLEERRTPQPDTKRRSR